MNLLLSLRSEILKTKRTASFYFTLIGAAIIPFIFLLNALTHGLPDEDKNSKDPLNAIFRMSSEMTGLAILPFFIILVCTLFPQLEYKNNTWKQVLTSPQSKANVFLAKFMNIHLLIVLFLVANHLFLWLAAIAIHFIIPGLHLLQQPLNGQAIWINILNSYTVLLAVCTLQFWMGLRFKSFLAPVATGLALWLTGTLLALEYHSDLAYYFPYSFQVFPVVPDFKPQLGQAMSLSAIYAVVVLLAGFLDFRWRRISQ